MGYVTLASHVDVSISAGAWTDINVSSYVPSGALGVVIAVENTSGTTSYAWGVRKNGASSGTFSGIPADAMGYGIVGLDASRIFEGYVTNAKVDFFLVGYFDSASNVVFFTNAYNITGQSTSDFVDVDVSGYSEGSDVAKMAFLMTATVSLLQKIRCNGSSDSSFGSDINGCAGMMFVPLDGNEIYEMSFNSALTAHQYVGYAKFGTFVTNAENEGQITENMWCDFTAGQSGGAQVLTFSYSQPLTEYAARPNGSSQDIISEVACAGYNRCHYLLTDKDGSEGYEVYLVTYPPYLFTHGCITDSAGGQEPITIGKVALDHAGKSLYAKETIHPALRALDWAGQEVSAICAIQIGKVALDWLGKALYAAETIHPGTRSSDWAGRPLLVPLVLTVPLVAADWSGQTLKVTETIHPALLALDWSGKTLLAHEKIVPALRALGWDGKDVTALVALLIQYADLGWSGKPLLANELIRPTKRTLDWLGGALAADEKIILGARTLDWAGETAWTTETLTAGSVALDWAGTTPLAHEQITAALRMLDWAGQEVMVTSGLIAERAILQWTGRNLAADETIEVGKKGADWVGTTPLASELLRVGILPTDWTGKGVNIGYTFLIAVVELDWLGRNVVDVATIRKKLRIIGTGFKRLIGG